MSMIFVNYLNLNGTSSQLSCGLKTRKRAKCLVLSEIMTIIIAFHQNHYRNFKHFYLDHVCIYWRHAFPALPSYQRFVEWMPSTLIPLCLYLKHCFGRCTGISFLDATKISVCHNRRIAGHRVFLSFSGQGKNLAFIGSLASNCTSSSMN